ncbi:MAG: ethanolamine utilization protein EutH [Gemmataceae bacterium]|nr:ethanolamine utilization protein EutH [Gemmataceae bacterium]
MAIIGIVVITVVMGCAVAGAIASLFNDEEGLGKEFLEGLRAIGYIFIPVAGIMASIPYLSALVRSLVGPAFATIGADPAMAATSVIAVDMGGYQLARSLTEHHASWIMAMLTGYMAGATIVFSIPVGLSLLDKRDHKYMALGVMSGLLSIPVGVFVSCLLLLLLGPTVRPVVATNPVPEVPLDLTFSTVLLNLVPLILFVGLLALGLRLAPDRMIRGFMIFGRGLYVLITLVLVASIVQYFTTIFYGKGLFTLLFGGWDFDPIIADADHIERTVNAGRGVRAEEVTRALEVAGYIGIMLAGAFPMVYLIKKYLARPMEKAGRKLGLTAAGAAGILAAVANILAMFRLVRDMRPKDKVLCIAFAVCAAFLFGDHLAFTANFQPNLILPVMAGKLAGGIFAFALAYRLSVPEAQKLEKQEMEEEVCAIAAHVPALKGKALTITELGGGLTNRNFKVDADGDSFVVRIYGEGTEALGIDREREVACSHAASGAGVGPEVIAHLPERRALVCRFVKGDLLKEPEKFRQPGTLRRVAQTLRRCHDYPAPPDLGRFSAFEVVRSYHAQAREQKVPLPGELDRALELLARIEQEVRTDEPLCLCHNDLLGANFIDDGMTIRLIDWEYGGLGDRFFDLGNFAVNNNLDAAQELALLEAYFGEVRPGHLRRLRLMRLVSDMREAMWGFLQAGISKLKSPEYYLDYGRTHLERFLKESDGVGTIWS